MKYAIVFGIFFCYLLAMAILIQRLGWVLLWPAFGAMLFSCAYVGIGPKLLGKRPNGTIAWWAFLFLLPWFLLTWILWHLNRLRGEDCHNEIVPDLSIGRRSYASELPENVTVIVDLTAEFVEPKTVRQQHQYLCFPMLDGSIPDADSCLSFMKELAQKTGHVYVHCALGHGRSAMTVALLLLLRGEAQNLKDARERILNARPGARWNREQSRFLKRLVGQIIHEDDS